MFRWAHAWISTSIAALALSGCGAGGPLPPAADDPATRARQQQAFVEALKPRRAGPPVVAVVALNEGTETTDLLLPHAVLRRAGVADVQVVAPRRGPVALYPALQIEAVQDFAGFDQAHPGGADYVIVPAMQPDDDPAVTAWLRRQAERGARVIGICSGALVVGQAGLLHGRRFASHWYYRDRVAERHPSARFVPHLRYVVDGDVATTTGISASVPAMLALVEAIGGRGKAQAVATELGVASWSPAHDSTAFGLSPDRVTHYLLNKAAFWRHERLQLPVHDGSDDIALALTADAWSRSGRASVQATAPGPVTLRSGLVLAAQPAAEPLPSVPLAPTAKPVQQLDRTLCDIARRYGDARREWVMQEMEYPGAGTVCAD